MKENHQSANAGWRDVVLGLGMGSFHGHGHVLGNHGDRIPGVQILFVPHIVEIGDILVIKFSLDWKYHECAYLFV